MDVYLWMFMHQYATVCSISNFHEIFSFRFLPEVISDMMLSTIDQTGKIGDIFVLFP